MNALNNAEMIQDMITTTKLVIGEKRSSKYEDALKIVMNANITAGSKKGILSKTPSSMSENKM